MKWAKNLILGLTILFLSGLMAGLFVIGYYSKNLPTLEKLVDYNPKLVTTIYSREGEIIAEFARERRKFLPAQEIPKTVVDAFLAAEDSEFFHHRGINPLTILRAAWKNFRAGATVQGGSTITQQVAKYFLLSSEKTMDRKIKEVLLAFRIEKALSKEQIISLYLNQIFLGNGAHGIEAASRIYFGKSSAELSIAEAAMLAGLPRAPSRDNPANNPSAAKQRQRYVLGRLLATERISQEEFDEASRQPLKVVITPEGMTTNVHYLAEHIRRELLERFGEEKLYEGGLSVYTTVSLKNQIAAQKAVDAGLRAIDKRMGLRRPQKKLANQNEIDEFLKAQHRQLTQDFYNFRLLLPDESELKDPITETEATPLKAARNYEAVVIGKNVKEKSLLVQVGNRKGRITPENYAWATRSNPEEIYSERVIRNPYLEQRIGDVLTVQLQSPEEENLEFILEQNPLVQGALVSYDVANGSLEAVVGGYDFEVTKSHFNRAVQAYRQPGSTFKAFVYAAAIEAGLTPSTIIVDSPIVYTDAGEKEGLEKSWKPGNYTDKFYGDTTLRNAFAYSRNIPTIKLAQHLKINTVIDFAKRMGITSTLAPDLSLALGSSAVGLNEMVTAWIPFANHGKKSRPFFLAQVKDRSGEVIFEDIAAVGLIEKMDAEAPEITENKAPATNEVAVEDTANDPNQVLSPEVSYIVTSLLKSVVDFGTGSSVQSLGRPIAGKTGTTNDFKDAWFIGYTTDVITGVWIGFDEDRPIGRNETGGIAAAPIWLEYMQTASPKPEGKEVPDFTVPKKVIRVTVDARTGDLPTSRTEKTLQEFFIDGNAPGQSAPENTTAVNSPNSDVSSLDKRIRTQVITGNPNFIGNSAEDPGSRDEGLDEMMREDL